MIGKIISKSVHSEKAAVLKKDAGNGEGKAAAVFKSLLDSLQGDNISGGNEKSMAEGMLSDQEMESLTNEVKNSEAANTKDENIYSKLSEGDPKNEEAITQFRQLLKQIKQEGQVQTAFKQPASAGEAADGSQEKAWIAQADTDLHELLSQYLPEEEAGRLAKAVASGQVNSVSDKIAGVLSEGNIKDEDIKAQLRQLLNRLQQQSKVPPVQFPQAEGAVERAAAFKQPASAGEAADGSQEKAWIAQADTDLRELLSQYLPEEEAGRLAEAVASGQVNSVSDKIARVLSEGNIKDEDIKAQLRQLLNRLQQQSKEPPVHSSKVEVPSGQAQAEGKNLVEGEASDESAEHKTDLLSRSRSDDKEMTVRGKSRTPLSDKMPGDNLSRDRLEQNIALNTGIDSAQSVDNVRNGRMEISNQPQRDDFFLKNISGEVSKKGLEMKGAQLRKILQKEDRDPVEGGTGQSGRAEGERGSFFGRSSLFADASLNNTVSAGVSGSGGSTDSTPPSPGEQEFMWKEYSAESADMKDDKETGEKLVGSSSLRLGQVPIANAALRTKVLPALTQNALAAASEARKTPEQWQKHNFVLDDGKKMQLSVREVQGVLQVKMGSMNLDLSKLLQQHLQQIREHLKQEFGSEIDLQLDHPEQEDSASHFSGYSPGRNGRDEGPLRSAGGEPKTDGAGNAKLKTVRNFGYNEMEWIA